MAEDGKIETLVSMNELQADTRSFFFFERKTCDLPYYRPPPDGFGLMGWLIVICAVALSFLALTTTQMRLHAGFPGFIPPLLFVLIPLVAVAAVAGPKAPLSLFRSLGLKDIGIILLFFVLNAVVTVVLGTLIIGQFETAANPASDLVASASGLDRILFFGWSAVQLLGE